MNSMSNENISVETMRLVEAIEDAGMSVQMKTRTGAPSLYGGVTLGDVWAAMPAPKWQAIVDALNDMLQEPM